MTINNCTLYHGDCIKVMKEMKGTNPIDMVLVDPPYGTTAYKWDKVLDLKAMWDALRPLVKENAAMLFFSQLPFACDLINSNRKEFRYEWVWNKKIPAGFLNSHKMPLRLHENILVFSHRLPTYNPQWVKIKPYANHSGCNVVYGTKVKSTRVANLTGKGYPKDIIEFIKPVTLWGRTLKYRHPTQKPVALLEYLIKTYTNPGEVVLDFCMGSGSCAEACVNAGRRFVGIEMDDGYYAMCLERVREAVERVANDVVREGAAGANDGSSTIDVAANAADMPLFAKVPEVTR